ncbi:MAG: prepilin-type N-terminal cleavage/methylation domain-containing protein [Deltaproteobacteria bacterium]|nr:prepilin-type N-terminal cleavage/methylation domain-containing protein [Deltaproteobacteria bacterium]
MRLTATFNSSRGHAGFTLTEVLVATTLTLVAMSGFLSFNRYQLLTLRNQANQIDVQTTARNVVDLFAREVRRAGMNPNCDIANFSGIADARSYSIRVQADLNNSGQHLGPNEDLTYTYNYSAKTVQRIDNNNWSNTDTLLSDVDLSGSSIRYFDGSGTELVPTSGSLSATDRSAIRRVRLQLSLRSQAADPLNGAAPSAQVATDVDLRNRFFIASTKCPGS